MGGDVQPEPLIYRGEVTAMFFTLTDISVKLDAIIRVLEEDDGEEEEEEDYEGDA